MHDETPGGLATRDRAMAYWTDQRNFPASKKEARRIKKERRREINKLRLQGAVIYGFLSGLGG